MENRNIIKKLNSIVWKIKLRGSLSESRDRKMKIVENNIAFKGSPGGPFSNSGSSRERTEKVEGRESLTK